MGVGTFTVEASLNRDPDTVLWEERSAMSIETAKRTDRLTPQGILETSLYVDDLDRARRFYEDVFGLVPMVSNQRICALDVNGRSVLLLFRRGMSLDPQQFGAPHDGSGPLHFAFAVSAEDLPVWEERLRLHDVVVEQRTTWPRGGQSLYFRDPDGHLGELATPGVWPTY
jgi:catechol 2,3-dioxygenase-like lactoylglutathione lyase family enzyme